MTASALTKTYVDAIVPGRKAWTEGHQRIPVAKPGLSRGGIVAMEILRQAPGRIKRLVLLDTNPLAEAPEVAARREHQIARAKNGDLEGVLRDEMKPDFLADGPDQQDLLDLCMAMALGLGVDVFERQSRALTGGATNARRWRHLADQHWF